MSTSTARPGSLVLVAPSGADHPRFVEAIVGRLLELVVYSVEGIRERLGRGPSTIH